MRTRLLESILCLLFVCAFFFNAYSSPPYKQVKLKGQKQNLYQNVFLFSPLKYNLKYIYPIFKKIVIPDSDGDGIIDRFDDCPLIYGVSERNGCPPIDMTKIITVACPTIIFTDEEFNNVVQAFAGLEFDISTLLASSHNALNLFIELLNNNPKWTVYLSAYCDISHDRDDNLNISERRLKELIRYLEVNGIDKKRISGSFFGDTMPVLDLPSTRFEVELNESVVKAKPQKKRKRK